MLYSDKIWEFQRASDNIVKDIAKKANIPKLLAKIFLNRGVQDVQYINKFLNPNLQDLHDPFLLEDMDIAVNRIINAMQNSESILIYGDYDVDGVTSTSILYDFLRHLDAKVDFYIPNRINEGYSLSMEWAQKLCEDSYSLIITVDCGVTSFN